MVIMQKFKLIMHIVKNNQNLCIKTEPATTRTDTTSYVWFLGQIKEN